VVNCFIFWKYMARALRRLQVLHKHWVSVEQNGTISRSLTNASNGHKHYETRRDFAHFLTIQTRWMDNDIYGHVNNVVYYSFFDTVINKYMIDYCHFDLENSEAIAVAVESKCSFKESISFPEQIDCGLRAGKIGRTSVRWEVGIFKSPQTPRKENTSLPTENLKAIAVGHFVHVFVDRKSRKPIPIPRDLLVGIERIAVRKSEEGHVQKE